MSRFKMRAIKNGLLLAVVLLIPTGAFCEKMDASILTPPPKAGEGKREDSNFKMREPTFEERSKRLDECMKIHKNYSKCKEESGAPGFNIEFK